jgi:hypothetical protein
VFSSIPLATATRFHVDDLLRDGKSTGGDAIIRDARDESHEERG